MEMSQGKEIKEIVARGKKKIGSKLIMMGLDRLGEFKQRSRDEVRRGAPVKSVIFLFRHFRLQFFLVCVMRKK